jgi:hypothetical protein
MSEVNRHRRPSSAQLILRIYRRQIETHKLIKALQVDIARLNASTATTAAVADHCRRLLAEKATMLKVIEANRFMNAALPRRFSTVPEHTNG